MTRIYRLPAELGAGEYEGRLTTFVGERWVSFDDINGAKVIVRESDLTQVMPPLPEPPNDSAVRVGRQIHRRDDLAATAYGDDGDAHWFGAGYETPHTWAELCTKSAPSGPVLLVPAPPVVALPWASEDHAGWDIRVEVSNQPEYAKQVFLYANGAFVVPARARDMAYALLTAADEAERRTDV